MSYLAGSFVMRRSGVRVPKLAHEREIVYVESNLSFIFVLILTLE